MATTRHDGTDDFPPEGLEGEGGDEPHNPTDRDSIMAAAFAEAFDPFADEDDNEHAPPDSAVADAASPRSSPRGSPRRGDGRGDASSADDAATREFDAAFASVALGGGATDRFGFPVGRAFASGGTGGSGGDGADDAPDEDDGRAKRIEDAAPSSESDRAGGGGLEGVTFVIAEEMSVIHRSRANQCSVKIRGSISLETDAHISPGQRIQCDISLVDPEGHVDAAKSKNDDYAQPIASAKEFITMTPAHADVGDAAFRITMPMSEERTTGRPGRPLVEYTCGDKLRPVPMLINAIVQELEDRCQILFRLRVNPRNGTPLSNAVALMSVPDEYDGRRARVHSAGIEGDVPADWNDMTRILSWRAGELHGGAIREFEASFPAAGGPGAAAARKGRRGGRPTTEAGFPVLLRYDSEGSLLSDADLDFGDGVGRPRPSVRRTFRVYHREV